MSQKRWRKGDYRELKSKTFPGKECPRHLLEACALGDRLEISPVLSQIRACYQHQS